MMNIFFCAVALIVSMSSAYAMQGERVYKCVSPNSAQYSQGTIYVKKSIFFDQRGRKVLQIFLLDTDSRIFLKDYPTPQEIYAKLKASYESQQQLLEKEFREK